MTIKTNEDFIKALTTVSKIEDKNKYGVFMVDNQDNSMIGMLEGMFTENEIKEADALAKLSFGYNIEIRPMLANMPTIINKL